MMEHRIKMDPITQIQFMQKLRTRSNLSWGELANKFKVTTRTMRDWRAGKHYLPFTRTQKIATSLGIALPNEAIKLEPLWHMAAASKRGAERRQELYGPLGTTESRRKGGLTSQQRRRKDPMKYRLLGCKVLKEYKPLKKSVELAELVGIILGDGTISDTQMRIFLSAIVDRPYALYVADLIEKVFGEKPTRPKLEPKHTIHLTLSGINIIKALEKVGLERGNKKVHQVSVPRWILSNKKYRLACMRGLFDTDGGLYFHRKKNRSSNETYYLGWSFCNHSIPLIQAFDATLSLIGLKAAKVAGIKLYLYSMKDIIKYLDIIGTSNPKNINRYKKALATRFRKAAQ